MLLYTTVHAAKIHKTQQDEVIEVTAGIAEVAMTIADVVPVEGEFGLGVSEMTYVHHDWNTTNEGGVEHF